jgi:hypothetical protein
MNWSVRNAIRYGIVLVAGIIAGSRAVSALQAWQQWRLWRERDPSGADGYRSFAEVDTVIAVLSLAIAVLIWWLLRPRSGKAPGGAAA